MTEYDRVAPTDVVPPVAYKMWPEIVPSHGVTIISGIRPEGTEALHLVYSSETPPWVLIGMLKTVMDDLTHAWQSQGYIGSGEDD
jgi:hypothetical protein